MKFKLGKKVCRIDTHTKSKSFIPGPGKYERTVEMVRKVTTFSPLSMHKRH